MLSDSQIDALLDEGKPAIDSPRALATFAKSEPRRGHRRFVKRVTGEHGTQFALHIRQSVLDPFDFSIILAYVPSSGGEITLRRHNGKGHPHVNKLEGTRVASTAFHIHYATERYQQHGFEIDGYAEEARVFADLATALDAMLIAANFEPPNQRSLWP